MNTGKLIVGVIGLLLGYFAVKNFGHMGQVA